MQKIKSFRKITHHLANAAFMLSAVTLLMVLIGHYMHLDLTSVFMTLITISILGILAALTVFAFMYFKHKTFSKLEHVSTLMIGLSSIVLVIVFIIETTLFR